MSISSPKSFCSPSSSTSSGRNGQCAGVPKTKNINGCYRRLYLQEAFPGLCIDELNEEHATRWFAEVNQQMEPGTANRAFGFLRLTLLRQRTLHAL